MNGPYDDREDFAAFLLRLRNKGIVSRELVAAFEATPRRDFLPGQWQSAAWSDRMVPIECGEAIEGVDLQATVIAALEIQPGNRVLEVGTGSGYTAAVMARLGGRVMTLDRYKTLVEQARQRFEKLGLGNVAGAPGRWRQRAAGRGAVRPHRRLDGLRQPAAAFVDQLSSGGIMIAPIGPADGEQILSKLTKVGSRFERDDIATVRLQPIVKGVAAVL